MKFPSHYITAVCFSLVHFQKTLAQDTIRDDETIQQDEVQAVQGSEMIEYLKDVTPEEVSVQCMQNKMCISIEKEFLAEKEITTFYDKLELRNITDKCSNLYINSNTDDDWETATHVELCTTDGFLSCGTRMEMNDTHVSYINQIITRNEVNQPPGQLMAPIIREYVIPWHCIYPLEYVVGLDTEGGYYIPEISPIEYITIQSPLLQKENTYPVFMQLFETGDYRKPFTEAPILSNTDKLFVEVKMVGPSDAAIQLVNCWSTPFGGQTQEEIDDYRFDIIQDYCVTEDASDSIAAEIIRNGRSHSSQYEANVFKYSQEVGTDQVYLHCNVRVCFEENGRCDVTAGFCDGGGGRRKRRALSDYYSDSRESLALDPSITTVHAGPFRLLSNDAYQVEAELLSRNLELSRSIIDSQETDSGKLLLGLPIMFIYCFIAIIVIIISLIFGIVFLVVKKRSADKKVQAKISSKDKTLQVIEQPNGHTFVVAENGKTVLNTKASISLGLPVANLPVAQGRSLKQGKNESVITMSSSISDSDRCSRTTHHTHLPNTNTAHSFTTASDQCERITYAESLDSSSVPGSLRTPSTSSDVRPIVAKVRQDSYYRQQGHNNNLTNAYNNSNNMSKKHKKSLKNDLS